MKKFFKKYTFSFFLLTILLLGSIPRGIELLNRNYLFGFDQGLFYQAVRDIVVNKHFTLIGSEVGGIGGFFQGPGWYYLLSIPYIIFRGDPYGAMVLMFALGAGSILLSVLLFEKLLGRKTALLIGFFLSLSPGIISQSRFFWPPFVITPLTLLFLFCVLKAYKGKKLYIPLAFFIIGLMTHFEIATGGSLLIASILSLLIVRPKDMLKLKTIVFSIGAFLITQSPLLLFDIRHEFISSKGLIKFLTHGSASKNVYSLSNHIDMFKDSLFSVSYNWYIGSVLLLIIGFSSYKIIKAKKVKKELKQFVLFLLICPLILFLSFLPMSATLWSWWFLELPVFLCVLLGISFSMQVSLLRVKAILYVVLLVYLFFFVNQTYKWYKLDLPDYGGTAKIKGKIDAINYIYKDAGSKNFGLLVFTPPVYTYPYDYLMYWYGKNKFGYIPPAEKKETFYLLIEPDPAKPTSYKGWLETVIKDGEVQKTVKLPSGFIIQKRVRVEQ